MKGWAINMIDGVTILHKTPVMAINHPWDVIFNAAIICFVLSIILAILFQVDFFGITMLLSMFTLLAVAAINPEEPTGRYQYEVVLNDNVTIGDLVGRYEIIDQRGDIWVLEDKE